MRKLLIADDQIGIRLLLTEVFQREGYEIYQAANGVEALQIVKDEQPHCLLLDMEMPRMNGAEVLKELQKNWPNIPVVLMTAHDKEMITEEVRESVDHLFTKPFDIHEVREVVNCLFDN